jgi:hypothetical protein
MTLKIFNALETADAPPAEAGTPNLLVSRSKRNRMLSWVITAVLLSGCATPPNDVAMRERSSFTCYREFSNFAKAPGPAPGETILTSPEIKSPNHWNELVVSWNASPGAYLKVEARALYPDHVTKFYTLGLWSQNPALHPRASVHGQKDRDGTVQTDTLILIKPATKAQIRITLGGGDGRPVLKFLGLSFCDTRAPVKPLEPNRAAWGKTLPVPERRQGEYEGGGGWCSPASLSMVLAYWGEVRHRPELNQTVPDVAAAIYDVVFDGVGNWPFNTAYAGGFPGVRAYVTRLTDVSELEDWVAAGVPPIVSVSSYLTNDRHSGPDEGHLIVCAGFTEQGDIIANDPGVSVKRGQRARRVYPRERFAKAWSKSRNAVYLVYPDGTAIPRDRFGHWEHGN